MLFSPENSPTGKFEFEYVDLLEMRNKVNNIVKKEEKHTFYSKSFNILFRNMNLQRQNRCEQSRNL